MIFSLILGLVLGAISVVFIIQNTTVITINFLSYHLQSSLALVILGALLMGMILAAIFSVPAVIRDHMKYSTLKKENRKLEDSLKEAQSKVNNESLKSEIINKHIADSM